MTQDPITPAPTNPPPIELMGALCSLLIHDFANHLSVISGNAQCAQLFANDPQRTASALSSILRAGESAADLLVKCGELRRGLAGGFPSSDLPRVAEDIARYAAAWPGWSVNVPSPLTGDIALPSYWIAFTTFAFAKESRAVQGAVTLTTTGREGNQPSSSFLLSGLSCHEFLEVKLTYKSDLPFPFDQIRSQHTNLGLLAACELVKTVGGRTACSTTSTTDQQVTICIPKT